MPELVGRYQIQARIGRGAMANVYRAYDSKLNRVLAIKILKAEFRQNRQYAARFLREAKAAGALSHPNIVTVYDVGEVDGHAYIAMELLKGAPLDGAVTPDTPLPASRVVEIGLQLADALRYAHDQGVIHRDIKPSNIMLGPDGRSIKILDFGIARMREADGAEADTDGLKTQIGQVIGTPRYMSPEQAFGQPADGRSDLFSVGVVLYELISGRKAFAGGSPASLALQITQQDPEPLADIAPGCPKGLQFIIQKLMAKSPDQRFASGAQLADALRREKRFFDSLSGDAHEARRRLPLPLRLALLMGLVTSIALAASTWAVVREEVGAMRRMALTSGAAIASFVANNAALQAAENYALPADQRDWLPVQAFVRSASHDPNVRQMAVVDPEGFIRASNQLRLVGTRLRPVGSTPIIEKSGNLTVSALPVVGGVDGFRFARPILYADRPFGQVIVDLNEAQLDAASQQAQALLAALALVTLGVVIASSYMVARLLAAPIRRLKAALSDASDGDLDFRISHHRNDEFGELFDEFNRFTAAVQARLAVSRAPRMATAAQPARPAARPQPLANPPAITPADAAAATIIAGARPERESRSGPVGSTVWRDRWARAVKHPPVLAAGRR